MLKGGCRACGRGIKGETRNRPKAPGSVNDPGAFVSPSFFPARRRTIPLKSAQAQISQYRSAAFCVGHLVRRRQNRSEEHTSELQSLMRISYAVFCLKKKNINKKNNYLNKL